MAVAGLSLGSSAPGSLGRFIVLCTAALVACTTVEEAPRVVNDVPGAPAVRPARRDAPATPGRPEARAAGSGATVAQTVNAAAERPEPDPQRRSRIRLELGTALYQQGSYAQALEEVRSAVAIDPNLAQAWGLLGLIQMDLGDRAKAQESFDRALTLAPDDSELRNNYGWFLCQTGRQREAIAEFLAALRDPLYATPARPLHNAGICSLRSGDPVAAEAYFQRAFQIDPSNPVSMYHLGELNLRRGNVEQARFYAQRLLASYPPSAETLWLALRVDRKAADRDGFNSLSAQLRRQFPASREAELLQRGEFGD
jgi:type IV pilus assembly protein PilF